MSNDIQNMLTVFPEMDESDPDQFNGHGKPELRWLKDRLGNDNLSGKDRDAAWKQYMDDKELRTVRRIKNLRKGLMNIRGLEIPAGDTIELDEKTLNNPDRMRRIERAIETNQLEEV